MARRVLNPTSGTKSETNSNDRNQMTETGNPHTIGHERDFPAPPFGALRHLDFEFVSDFDIRILNLLLPTTGGRVTNIPDPTPPLHASSPLTSAPVLAADPQSDPACLQCRRRVGSCCPEIPKRLPIFRAAFVVAHHQRLLDQRLDTSQTGADARQLDGIHDLGSSDANRRP